MSSQGIVDAHGDEDSLKRAWAVVNSFKHIHINVVRALNQWLPTVIDFVPWHLTMHEQRLVWETLKLPSTVVDELMFLSLRFEGGRLCVNPIMEHDTSAPQRISSVLLRIWQMAEWTTSRWLSLARTCRRMLAARVTGLHSMVEFLRARGEVGQFYLSGWDKANAQVKHLFVIAGLAGSPTDLMLSTFFRDDRVPLVIDGLCVAVHDAIVDIDCLPLNVWMVYAAAIDGSVTKVRSDTIGAILTSVCFSMWRLAPARSLPYTLCGDDKDAKLDQLMAAEPPRDTVSRKVFDLLELGFPRETLRSGLHLMGQMSWSSNVVEQGHATCSRVMRHHPEYGADTMACRSMLMQMHVLLTEDTEVKHFRRARARLLRLRRQRPQMVNGRHVLAAKLMSIVKAKRRIGLYQGAHIGRRVIKTHANIWKEMPAAERRALDDQARLHRSASLESVADKMDECREQIRTMEEARRDRHRATLPTRMSSCKLSVSEKRRLDECFAGSARSLVELRRQRQESSAPFSEPAAGFQEMLEAIDVLDLGDDIAPLLPWIRSICALRAYFATSLFRVRSGSGEDTMFRVLFALQNPIVAGFVRITSIAVPETTLSPERMMNDPPPWKMRFKMEHMSFAFSDTIGFLRPEDEVFVIRESVCLGNGTVVADEEWASLEVVLQVLPDVASGGGTAHAAEGPRRRPRLDEGSVRDHPWLFDLFGMEERPRRPGNHDGESRSARAHDNDDTDGGAFDIEVDQVMEDLERRREEVRNPSSVRQHFGWSVRGGAWTAAHRGVAFDSYRAAALTRESKAWATEWGLPTTATFALSRYGDEAAAILAQFWVEKMDFLWTVCKPTATGFGFRAADLAAFEEPAAAVELLATAQGHTLRRLQEVRAMAPVVPK